MNGKLRFAATVAISLSSSIAFAGTGPVHTKLRTDDNAGEFMPMVQSVASRAEVKSETRRTSAEGTLLRAGDNTGDLAPASGSTVSRTDVKAAALQASRDGTLQRSDNADEDRATAARVARQHAAARARNA